MEQNTVRKVVEAFRTFAADRGGKPSDDNAWSTRLIYYILNTYRNAIIYEKRLGKSLRKTSEHLIQTIPCVTLVEADRDECPCNPASGCTFLKSVYPLPKPLEDQVFAIVPPSGQGLDDDFDYVKWHNFKWKVNSRIGAQTDHGFYTWKNINNKVHLYIHNRELLERVSVVMIAEDPLDVVMFPDCNEDPVPICDMLVQEFNLDKELQPKVFELSFNFLQNMRSLSPGADFINNDRDDASAPTPQV